MSENKLYIFCGNAVDLGYLHILLVYLVLNEFEWHGHLLAL